jgi:hypothetical protein
MKKSNKHSLGELYFSGFRGSIKTLKRTPGKIMFVLDANLILNLMNKNLEYDDFPNSYKDFLRISRNKAYKSWSMRGKWIPIDPVLAIMELTKQDKKQDFKIYEAYFNDFFEKIYRINNFDPRWIYSTYEVALKAVSNTHPSIKKTIEKLYKFIAKNDKPTQEEIIAGCDKFIEWIWSERDDLVLIGGFLFYVAIYAIAGSPEARQVIKLNKIKKEGASEVANNVAWDFLYWLNLDTRYFINKYDNTIICTGDKALATLLGSKEHTGSRFSTKEIDKSEYVEAKGNIKPYKFKRLENTKLEKTLYYKFMNLYLNLDRVIHDSVKFGFDKSLYDSFIVEGEVNPK